ncbi:hypothetical protein HOY80DRAFT_1044282 [Tuber brumale]|nr:hypothetical protein HOY80DRAFT_1044282 [Tuber brumale]
MVPSLSLRLLTLTMVKRGSVFSTASFARSSLVLSFASEKNFTLQAEVLHLRHHISVLSQRLDHAMKEVAALTASLKAVATAVIPPSTIPSVGYSWTSLAARMARDVVEEVADQDVVASLQVPKPCVAVPIAEGAKSASVGTPDVTVEGGSSSSAVDHPQPECSNGRKNNI